MCFGGPSFLVAPNFADAYQPLVELLHDGPSDSSHLCVAAGAPQPRGSDSVAVVEPKMPTLRQMHEIVAADPGAQAY